MFQLGEFAAAGDIYYLDDVRLEKVTPPAVIENSPTGKDVSVEAQITVNFSEAMNQSSVQSSFSTIPETTGDFSWNGNIMTYIPVNLSYNTVYNITIGNDAKDLSGNNMLSSYNWQFITESPPANSISNPGAIRSAIPGLNPEMYHGHSIRVAPGHSVCHLPDIRKRCFED